MPRLGDGGDCKALIGVAGRLWSLDLKVIDAYDVAFACFAREKILARFAAKDTQD